MGNYPERQNILACIPMDILTASELSKQVRDATPLPYSPVN